MLECIFRFPDNAFDVDVYSEPSAGLPIIIKCSRMMKSRYA